MGVLILCGLPATIEPFGPGVAAVYTVMCVQMPD